jgi:hemoglobin-like flavoprotein
MAENDQVRASFDRCEGKGEFAKRFYEMFLAASPEIEPLFAKTNKGYFS